jgi:hypothetical protein
MNTVILTKDGRFGRIIEYYRDTYVFVEFADRTIDAIRVNQISQQFG